MRFQRGQAGIERAPQRTIPRDEGVHFHPGCLEHPGAFAKERRVQARFRPGVKIVDGNDLRPGRSQDGSLFRRGGGGIDRHRHLGGQGAGFFQGKAVVQTQAPQAQLPREGGNVPAAELPGRHLRDIGQNAPAVFPQPAAHGPHAGRIIRGKFFPDVQRDKNRRTACRTGGKRCFLFLKLCQIGRPSEKIRHRRPPQA